MVRRDWPWAVATACRSCLTLGLGGNEASLGSGYLGSGSSKWAAPESLCLVPFWVQVHVGHHKVANTLCKTAATCLLGVKGN